MLVAMGSKFEAWSRKYLPDPLVIAMILTVLVMGLGIVLTPHSLVAMTNFWVKGFWELLAFSMQVSFGLIAGAVLAQSRPIKKGMSKLCGIPNTSGQAVMLLGFITTALWWINWGIGLIAGAFLAKEMATRLREKKVAFHAPMIAAAGYAGIISYEMGITGAVPLWIATKGHRFEAQMGVIPLTDTIFSTMNVIITIGVLVLVPLVLWWMTPKDPSKMIGYFPGDENPASEGEAAPIAVKAATTFAERVERTPIWSWLIGLLGIVWAVAHFYKNGFQVDLNVFNFIILIVGLLIWGSPLEYARCFREQTTAAWGIILQFHFYAGIMGMMMYSGMVPIIATWFVAISTAKTYSLIVFLSAGLINFFIPSGGGQWAVQGPIMLEAAKTLSIDVKTVALAVGYGDSWSNLASPFWALPIAGVLGIKVRDFLGYTIVVTFVTGIFICAVLYLFS